MRVVKPLLRLPAVEDATGLKKSAIYQRLREGRFPQPVRLGAKAVAWRSEEVQQWIDSRPRVEAQEDKPDAIK